MRRSIFAAFAALAASGLWSPLHAQDLPPFLKPYYAQSFSIAGNTLQAVSHSEQNGAVHYVYVSTDQSLTLTVDNYSCTGELCRTVFTNALKYANDQAKSAGQFLAVTDTEFRVRWKANNADMTMMVLRLPASLQFWTYAATPLRALPIATFDQIESAVNRQRYEDAHAEGNIEMGHWDRQIREYALELLKERKKPDALAVLRDLIATSPFDFEAHLALAENTPDAAAARASALTVTNNAESPEWITKAARLLKTAEPNLSQVPPIDRNDHGLQVILVPIGNPNLQLIQEAGKIYQKITGIPVKVRKLPNPFVFGTPDRMLNERQIQQAVVQKQGPNVDFFGWDAERYGDALMTLVDANDPLATFQMQTYVRKLGTQPGQYLADGYIDRFANEMAPVRSADPKTIYVGVTDANIYLSNTNYVYSGGVRLRGIYASVLSYASMTAKTLGEAYESRKRLAERLAKEMVPATLQALNIPRATDPTDPYSYSSGIERLNEKTLTLSDPTREALDKFR